MIEQNTAPTSTDTPPHAPPAEPKDTKAQTADSDVFAVYDTVFQRYVGGTFPSKAKADAAAKELVKDKKVRKAQVRKV